MGTIISVLFMFLGILTFLVFPILFLGSIIFLLYSGYVWFLQKRKNKFKKRYYTIAITSLVFLPFFYVGIFFLWEKAFCSNEKLPMVSSLGGQYSAQVQSRNCGVTTSNSTLIQIQNNDSGKKVRTFFYEGFSNDLRLKWLTDNELEVTYTGTSCGIMDQASIVEPDKNEWNDLKITYVNNCSLEPTPLVE